MKKLITEKQKNEIIDFYKSKPMSKNVLCEKYNLSLPTITKILKDIPQYTKTQIFNPDIKEDYFENIDSQEKAYFLGLIISDGNIYDPDGSSHTGSKWVSITLDEKDSYMLELFKKCVGLSSKVAKDGRGSEYIAVRSTIMAKSLSKYGVVPRKSFLTYFPFNVDKKYYSHLMRGIIDGDGSIQAYFHYTPKDNRNRFKHSISCCGTHRLMSDMVDIIKSIISLHNDIKVYDYKNRSLSEFKITQINDMYEFGKWLYKDAKIFLIRKYENFQKFIEHYKLTPIEKISIDI